MATIACARKSWYAYNNAPGKEPLQPRAVVNFMLGDMVEACVSQLGRLAGCNLTRHNERFSVPIPGMDREITCIPDDLLSVDGKLWNVEYKSMSSYAFSRFEEEEELEDAFGYATQVAMEEYAWKHGGVPVVGTVMVACRKETGHLAEKVLVADPRKVDEVFERCRLAAGAEMPERGFQPVDEAVRKKPTGRLILPLNCAYCDYHNPCHPNLMMETNSYGKPVWVLPKEVSHGS